MLPWPPLNAISLERGAAAFRQHRIGNGEAKIKEISQLVSDADMQMRVTPF